MYIFGAWADQATLDNSGGQELKQLCVQLN